jgi:hypothetical protein
VASTWLDERADLLLQIRIRDHRRQQEQADEGRGESRHNQGQAAAREEQRAEDEVDDQRLALAGHQEHGEYPDPEEMQPAAPFRLGEQNQSRKNHWKEDERESRVGNLFPSHPVAVGDVPRDGPERDRGDAQQQPPR